MPDGGAAAADMKRAPRAPGRANLPLLPLGPGGVQSGAAARGTEFHSTRRLIWGTSHGIAARIAIACNDTWLALALLTRFPRHREA